MLGVAKNAGYSGTPLAKKLGIKERYIISVINQPANYLELFTDMPADVVINDTGSNKKQLIHFFTTSAGELSMLLPQLKNEIVSNGSIWVSWPKRSSKVATDITEDTIRHLALSIGLVDIKVCAVDDTWSGLKLVIPVKDR